MKVFCKVHGKDAVIAGYAPGKKGRIMAVVITEGALKAVRLKDIVLDIDNAPSAVANLDEKRRAKQ